MATIKGTNGIDSIVGTSGNDTITGRGGNDVINAGAGNDKVDAGAGNDIVNGGDGNDTIDGGSGNDTLHGDGGNDDISGGSGDDIIYGDAGNDDIDGGQGNDTLYGGSGNDVISGGEGNDHLDGGNGNDTIVGKGGNDKLYGEAGNDTIRGSSGADIADGGAGNDVLSLDGGNDQAFYKFSENIGSQDVYSGGSGSDTLNIELTYAQSQLTYVQQAIHDYQNFLLQSSHHGQRHSRGDCGDDNGGNAVFNFGAYGPDFQLKVNGFETLVITIVGSPNQAPTTTPVTLAPIAEDSGARVITQAELLANASDVDSPLLTATGLTIGTGAGNLVDNGDGTWTYTPALNDDTAVTFHYNVTDGSLTAAGSASLDITTVNDLPVANADSITLSEDSSNVFIDVLNNDTDVEHDALSVISVDTTNTVGAVTFDASGVHYTASGYWDALDPEQAGSDSFTYTVSDGHGGIAQQVVNVTIQGAYEDVIGTNGNDNLSGGAYADHIQGLDGNDTLHGLNGNDLIEGGNGTDTLFGDDGNDIILGDDGNNDSLFGGNGNDYLDGGTGINDTATFTTNNDMIVNMLLGTADGEGHDRLVNIDNISTGIGNDTIYGDDNNNTIFTGAGNDTVYAGGGNDTIFAQLGDDYYDGQAGIDTYIANVNVTETINLFDGFATGGGGNDTLVNIENATSGSGNDFLYSSLSDNILDGATGTDTAIFKSGNDMIVNLSLSGVNATGEGNDQLLNIENVNTGAGQDIITGDANNNVIDAGAGKDTVNGGTGIDTITYANAGSAETVNLLTNSASGGYGNDTLTNIENIIGSNFDDTLSGDGDNNTISGGNGNDILMGGAGNDTLDGGAGTDTASYAQALAAVTVNLANHAATGGDDSDTLANIENITGSIFNDNLTGDSNNNVISGGLGFDTIDGGAGTDLLSYVNASGPVFVNLGIGTSSGADGNDNFVNMEDIAGSNFNDVLTGNSGANTIMGGLGADTLDGGAGSDTVSYANASGAVTVILATNSASGADGNDTLANFENILGSNFNDTLTGSSIANTIEGGLGDDTLDGGAGLFDVVSYANSASGVTVNLALHTATGGEGNDTLLNFENVTGSQSDDTITGDSGNNSISGRFGNDTINGGAGNDTLTGNFGLDTFVFTSGTGNDTITDFTSGQDLVDLTAYHTDFSSLTFTTNAAGFDVVHVGADTITLNNITSVDATNFIF